MGKKAWLQRYSDEDRNTATQGDNPEGMEEEGKKEPLKDCYVNCSYISPTKDGVSKSPISMMRDLTGKTEDESTSSASESESQVSLSSYQLCWILHKSLVHNLFFLVASYLQVKHSIVEECLK